MNSTNIFPAILLRIPQNRNHPLNLKSKLMKKNKLKYELLLEFSELSRVVMMCKRCESEGGRVDFVEETVKSGRWMSMGWNDDDNGRGGDGDGDGDGGVKSENGLVQSFDFDIEKYGMRNNASEKLNVGDDFDVHGIAFSGNSSSSSRSQKAERDDVLGVEGILPRLKKHRNLSFDRKNGSNDHDSGNSNVNHQSSGTLKDADSYRPEGSVLASLSHDKPMFIGNDSDKCYSNTLTSSIKADSWRTWSVQRAVNSDEEFEAAEIDIGGSSDKRTVDDLMAEPVAVPYEVVRGSDVTKCLIREISQSDVKGLLQHLQLELSSALHSLNLNTTDLSEKAKEHLSEDARLLSDASEFWENKIMYTEFKLRSMRAKLAIIEGKMALAIIGSSDAQKILEEKQKRIDDARQALELLHTTCIVWPNSGSEVLLTGSFDGWTTQRKMERSRSGIFALFLKLYPGQYEFKFIVDSVWMVDPLRPIVNHGGFENNRLIFS